MTDLTPKAIRTMPTAALRIVQQDLRLTLVPQAVRNAQTRQRQLTWVDREMARRRKEAR